MDVSHELGALRFVVDSPLSSKVAMFNQQVNQHKQAQLLNPFSNTDGRASPKPSFSKDEYGKPLAGSLTEMRGQKANIHVLKEMLELCQIIDSEGYNVKDEPSMRVIPFGELFNIYNYISDKVVGILLRARKHKLVEFEGEMLFQRRDDDVPIFLLKPIHEIRRDMEDKIESIKRCGSASPQATSVLLDRKGLNIPRGATPVSRTPSPESSKAGTPMREIKPKPVKSASLESPKIEINDDNTELKKTEIVEVATENKKSEVVEVATENKKSEAVEVTTENKNSEVVENKPIESNKAAKETEGTQTTKTEQTLQPLEVKKEAKPAEVAPEQQQTPAAEVPPTSTVETSENKADVNNNTNNILQPNDDLPTIVIEATAVYERSANTEETSGTEAATNQSTTITTLTSESTSPAASAPAETPASA